MTEIDLKLFYCRPCTMHNRITTRFSDAKPKEPCRHAGSGRNDCKRVEWVERNYYCVRCAHYGRTSIYYGTDIANAPCEYGHRPGFKHGQIWAETHESHYVFRDIPFHGGR